MPDKKSIVLSLNRSHTEPREPLWFTQRWLSESMGYAPLVEARSDVFDYIERFYNQGRVYKLEMLIQPALD